MRTLNNWSIRDTVSHALDALDFAAISEGKEIGAFFVHPIYISRTLSLSMKLLLVSLFPRIRLVFLAGKFHMCVCVYACVDGDLKFKLPTFERNLLFREKFIWTDLILRFSETVFTLALEITYPMYRVCVILEIRTWDCREVYKKLKSKVIVCLLERQFLAHI